MGKQVIFYLSNQDIDMLEKQILAFDFQIVLPTLKNEQIIMTDTIKPIPNISLTRYLVLKNQTAQLHLTITQEREFINLRSPIIEIVSGAYKPLQKSFVRGRMYYNPKFLNDKQEWENHNEEFLKAAEKLFRWFKKTFKTFDSEELSSYYTSENVIDKMKNENAALVLQ
ncbi:MAG: hypothetical protein MUE81_14580 [Thermoflexibacter sp.]|nr:hypothetical protein [Thermoflexibacter sp.]